jgi:hypothetical protein
MIKNPEEISEGKLPPPGQPWFHRCAGVVCCNLVLVWYIVTSQWEANCHVCFCSSHLLASAFWEIKTPQPWVTPPVPFLERSRCWPASVINLPFLQPPRFESCSCWSDILPATFWKPQQGQTTEPHWVMGPSSLAVQPVGVPGTRKCTAPMWFWGVSFHMTEGGCRATD